MSDEIIHHESCECEGCNMTGKAGRYRTKVEKERLAELAELRTRLADVEKERDALRKECLSRKGGSDWLQNWASDGMETLRIRLKAAETLQALAESDRDALRRELGDCLKYLNGRVMHGLPDEAVATFNRAAALVARHAAPDVRGESDDHQPIEYAPKHEYETTSPDDLDK